MSLISSSPTSLPTLEDSWWEQLADQLDPHKEKPDVPIWTPHPDNVPQGMAYQSDADITGYGGAAGGGKTDLLLGLAGTQHRKSIIYRWEFPLLRDIIERSREIFPPSTGARLNENTHVWRGLPGDRTLEFGAIHHINKLENHRGRPHDAKLFDEATEFPEKAVRFISGWNRTTVPDQRCRVVLAFNPPTTQEGLWVVRYFAPWLDPDHPNKAKPGELRWFVTVSENNQFKDIEVGGPDPITIDGEERLPRSRTFIWAFLKDNPFLSRDREYEATLDNLPEPLRSQLKKGIFLFNTEDDPWQVIPREWLVMAHRRWESREQPDVKCTTIGCDIARGGKDRASIAKRYGNWFAPIACIPGSETPDGPTAAAFILREHEDDALINIDVIGVGGSVYDSVAPMNVTAQAVNFAGGSEHLDRSGKLKMRNKRAEAYWRLHEALDPEHGEELALPPDEELDQELLAHRYKVTPSGILIEEKEAVKSRIGRSPDKAEAVVLAMLEGDDGTWFA
jgi:hypothetical protein